MKKNEETLSVLGNKYSRPILTLRYWYDKTRQNDYT